MNRPQTLRVAGRSPILLEIDTDAIADNTRLLAARTPKELLVVVKGDGYGHGAATLAHAAVRGGASWVGVTGIGHGVALREAGIGVPILSWLHDGEIDPGVAAGECIDLAIGSFDDLAAVARSGRRVRVHLNVDTGLAREGFAEADWVRAAALLADAERKRRITVVGLMSHLASADAPGHPANGAQRLAFERALAVVRAAGLRPTITHLGATSAVLTAPETPGTLVRVGAGTVGIDLTATTDLRGAMTLTAPLLDVREVAAGTASGYGHLWRSDRATRLGLVPVGYADGLPRAATALRPRTAGSAAGSGPEVLVAGRRVPVVGPMSMNALVVDLGPDGPARPGDPVTVFGAPRASAAGSPESATAPTVAEWAAWAGTIPQDVVTSVGRALPRVVVGSAASGAAWERRRTERRSA